MEIFNFAFCFDSLSNALARIEPDLLTFLDTVYCFASFLFGLLSEIHFLLLLLFAKRYW